MSEIASSTNSPDPLATESIWRRDLTPWLSHLKEPRPLSGWARWLAVAILTAGGLFSATLLVIYVDLTIDPGQLAIAPPRPGATWTTQVVIWRAVLVLLALLVCALIFTMAVRTLVRSRREGFVASGPYEQLAIAAGMLIVTGFSFLFVIRDTVGRGYVPWSAARIAAVAGAGAALLAGIILSSHVGRAFPPGKLSLRSRAAAVGLCLLAAAAGFADFSRPVSWYSDEPPASVTSGSFPNELLASLTGEAFTQASLLLPTDWASEGFATFSATNPDLAVGTAGADCLANGCLLLGIGNGGNQTLGVVSPSKVVWRSGVIPGESLSAWLACVSLRQCLAGSQAARGVTASADGGQSWSAPKLPRSTAYVDIAVVGGNGTCLTTGRCVLLATETLSLLARRRCGCYGRPVLLVRTNLDAKWELEPIDLPLNGSEILDGLSCPTAQQCFVAGSVSSQGVILRTKDGGRSWKQLTLPIGTPPVLQIACTNASHCLVVGSIGLLAGGAPVSRATAYAPWVLRTSDGGATWRRSSLALTDAVLTSVACTPSGSCLAAGERVTTGPGVLLPAGALVLLRSSGWNAVWLEIPSPAGRFSVSDVSCNSNTCLITGAEFNSGRTAQSLFGADNFDLSPTSTGIVVLWSPNRGVHLESPPVLPAAAVQSVDLGLP